MADPGNSKKNNNTNNKQSNPWLPFLIKSGMAAVIISGGYYYFKHYMRSQSIQPAADNDDERPYMYAPTPLGDDFEDTEDQSNTTFYTQTVNVSGDGIKMGVREEYIATLLQQRRTLSVLKNPHLNHHKIEHYFHLGFDSSSPILSIFNRIKWVIIVRNKSDVQLVGQRILNEFPQFKEERNDNHLPKPIGSTDRFYMLQISSIIIVSCGIGAASISILLQEITKVLVDAGAFAPNENNTSLTYQTSYVEYILLISAPGIKTSPNAKVYKRRNSLNNILDQNASQNKIKTRSNSSFRNNNLNLADLKVNIKNKYCDDMKDMEKQRPTQITNGEVPVFIPTSCYNEKLSTQREFTVCGENITRCMKFDRNLISDIKIRCGFLRSLKPRLGKGLSVRYFNEALSHNSVAISQETNVKSKFIQSCIDADIKYVDMESGYFAAFCNKLNISCVAIVGIEYDIAAPNKANNNMRVSHNTALHATLDIFCQYLWDRIAKDVSVMKLKRGKSHINSNNNNNNKRDEMSNKDVNESVDDEPPELKSSRSVPTIPIQSKQSKQGNENNHVAPAAFAQVFNDSSKNDNEGTNDY